MSISMPQASMQRRIALEHQMEARNRASMHATKSVLLFVNKTIESPNLSRSLGTERSSIFRHVQPRSKNKSSKDRTLVKLLPERRDQPGDEEPPGDGGHCSQQSDTHEQGGTSASLARISSIVVHDELLVQYSLINSNEQLSQQLIVLLGGSKTPSVWLTYVPSYIDGNQNVAFAAKALMHARKAQLCENRAEDIQGSKYYHKCLILLRTSITASGGCLLTIALLALYEQSVMTSLRAWGAHMKALAALLLEGGPSHRLGQLAPIFLFMSKGYRYLMPLAAGTSSPFEQKLWLNMHPVSNAGMTADVKKLKILSNKIFILLPRLVAGLRKIREDGSGFGTFDGIPELVRLVAHLQTLKDPMAESVVLFDMTLRPTTDVDDSRFIPFSYASAHFEVILTLAGYWEAHLALANMCRVLGAIVEEVFLGLFELEISGDKEHLAVNILMCLCRFSGAMASYVVFSSALFSVWRATSDRGGLCGLDEAAAKAWLSTKISVALSATDGRSMAQMIDETSEMMVGGPLREFWVEAFQQTNCVT